MIEVSVLSVMTDWFESHLVGNPEDDEAHSFLIVAQLLLQRLLLTFGLYDQLKHRDATEYSNATVI